MNLFTNLTILFVMLETENVTIRQASQYVYCVKINVMCISQNRTKVMYLFLFSNIHAVLELWRFSKKRL